MIYETADKCVKEVEKLSDNWEIFIANSETINVESKNDILSFAKQEIEKGVGIRIIKDNKIGFAYTTDLDKIYETAQKALDNAKLNKLDENYEFAHVEKVTDVKGTYDARYDDLSLDECCKFLENIIERTKDNDCNVISAGFSASKGEELIINSNGVSIYDKGTGFSGGLSVYIEKDGQYAASYDYNSSRHLDLEYEKLTDDACKLVHDSLNPKTIETKNCDVILDYYAASGLLSTFIQGFNSENVLRGRSILHDKINTEITDSNLTIIDNPLLENAMGTSKCDGEGTASKKTTLVEDGVLKSFLYDIYTANKSGCESTSNGYRASYLTTPDVSPSNLELKFKNSIGLDEIDSGIITTNVLGAHTANPISGDFSVELSNAFTVENGEITDGVKKAMISGNIYELMKKCESIESEIKQKGSFIIPKIMIHDLKVIGL
ncbi:TldD/PmbA family protein [Methanobrevibacter sp.]|uniref:TldD/PmbA family protein n=1 Tax=Methanobrevibacter sp. TaxID=66852 RepID=UPI002E798A2D|nr:TldD/PmbA family protein [Methanobrevibacter sp.]MEE0024169.1 TldD/PmbA family protein [Methanobrevibacter sp.]